MEERLTQMIIFDKPQKIIKNRQFVTENSDNSSTDSKGLPKISNYEMNKTSSTSMLQKLLDDPNLKNHPVLSARNSPSP